MAEQRINASVIADSTVLRQYLRFVSMLPVRAECLEWFLDQVRKADRQEDGTPALDNLITAALNLQAMLPAEVKFAAEAINAARKISELHLKAKKGTEPGFLELAKALQGAEEGKKWSDAFYLLDQLKAKVDYLMEEFIGAFAECKKRLESGTEALRAWATTWHGLCDAVRDWKFEKFPTLLTHDTTEAQNAQAAQIYAVCQELQACKNKLVHAGRFMSFMEESEKAYVTELEKNSLEREIKSAASIYATSILVSTLVKNEGNVHKDCQAWLAKFKVELGVEEKDLPFQLTKRIARAPKNGANGSASAASPAQVPQASGQIKQPMRKKVRRE